VDIFSPWSILHRQTLQLRVDYADGEIAPSSLAYGASKINSDPSPFGVLN